MTNENKPTIELGKQYQTRDGREVRIYAVDGSVFKPVHGAIKCLDGWCPYNWSANGEHPTGDNCDLIEIKPKRKIEFWVNVYPNAKFSTWFNEVNANVYADSDRLALLHFTREYEEGEGL